MGKETIKEIYDYLIEVGQKDLKFRLGETIKYSPSEIYEILSNMPKNCKPPIGVKPFWAAAEERIKDLAEAILRYADDSHNYDMIKKWSNEIYEQCCMVDLLRDDY